MRKVRHMNDIGAGDVVPGQIWFHSDTTEAMKGYYVVKRIDDDRCWMHLVKGHVPGTSMAEEVLVVTFGTLLSSWVLAREAPVPA